MMRHPEPVRASAAGAGLSLALLFAGIGAIQDLTGVPAAYERFGFFVTALGAGGLYLAAGMAVAWLGGAVAGVVLRGWTAAISLGLMLAFGAYNVFFRWTGAYPVPLPGRGGEATLGLIGFSAVFFVAATAALRRVDGFELWRHAMRIALPAGITAMAAALVLWGFRYSAGPWTGLGVVALLALAVASARVAAPRTPFLAAGLLAVVVAGGFWNWRSERAFTPVGQIGGAQGKISRVILITVDTLRADSLFGPGDQRPATPALDAFAAESVVFDRALSAGPWTPPGMAGLLTGLDPFSHRIGLGSRTLAGEFVTLPERMAGAGYELAGSGLNPLVRSAGLVDAWPWIHWHPYRPTPAGAGSFLLAGGVDFYDWNPSTTKLVDFAVDWFERHGDLDFFYWLHIYDPHGPYSPPADLLDSRGPAGRLGAAVSNEDIDRIRTGHLSLSAEERRRVRRLYDAEVAYADRELARFFETLRRRGIYDDSLIFLTSDHGEEFFEHGGFEHGQSLYNELVHVPLLIRPPGGADGRVVSEFVSTASVAPTALDLAGVDYDAAEMSYPSLQPYLDGGEPPAAPPLFHAGVRFHENWVGVVFDGKKYIRRLVSGREELYDLVEDPGETVVLDDSDGLERGRALIVERMAHGKKMRQRFGVEAEADKPLDDATRRQLESLGYIQ